MSNRKRLIIAGSVLIMISWWSGTIDDNNLPPFSQVEQCDVLLKTGIFPAYRDEKYRYSITDKEQIETIVTVLRENRPCKPWANFQVVGQIKLRLKDKSIVPIALYSPHYFSVQEGDKREYFLFDSLLLVVKIREYSPENNKAGRE